MQVVWSQDFANRIEALEAEARIKKWSRAKKRALAEGDYGRLRTLSKKADWRGYRERRRGREGR